ncbi:MAG: hypothetical protein IPG61_19550 [bacterium]|nr:hypothetical protein [bacterium]
MIAMRCLPWIVVAALGLAVPVHADEAGEPPRADRVSESPRLRTWHLALQSVDAWRNHFDVFDQPGLPPAGVDSRGKGGGMAIGRRFGDRFLAQVQFAIARHDIDDMDEQLIDIEVLLTGTVLFRPLRTFQPFLRGGLGGGGQALELPGNGGQVVAVGPVAIAGGGAQIRLGDRFSLEIETVATFTDFLEVHDESNDRLWDGDDWQVRISNRGWRTGVGLVFWF